MEKKIEVVIGAIKNMGGKDGKKAYRLIVPADKNQPAFTLWDGEIKPEKGERWTAFIQSREYDGKTYWNAVDMGQDGDGGSAEPQAAAASPAPVLGPAVGSNTEIIARQVAIKAVVELINGGRITMEDGGSDMVKWMDWFVDYALGRKA